jgi:hypothetical protein
MKALPVIKLLLCVSALAVGGSAQARPPALPASGDVEAFQVFVINNSDESVVGGIYDLRKDTSGNDMLTLDPSMTFDPSRTIHDKTGLGYTGISAIVGPGKSALTDIFFIVNDFKGGVYNVALFGKPTSASAPGEAPFTVPVSLELDADSACSGANEPSYCTSFSTLPDVIFPAAAPAPSAVPEAGGLIPFSLGALGVGALVLKARKRKEA